MSRYSLVRYAGLAATALLATSAYLGGALPAQSDLMTIWRGEQGPLIYLLWLTGTSLLVWAWWVVRDSAPSARWAAVTAALWSVPLLAAPPLGSRDVYSYACVGFTYAAGLDPYVNSVSTLPCPWLESVAPIWRDTPSPYGPLFVLLSGAMVTLGGTLVASIALFRAIAIVGVGITALCLPALARRCEIPESQAVWLGIASPLVVIHQVSGAHNDALMVGLLVAGLALVASSPGQTLALVGGGALLGLAGTVKATAWVAVPFAALTAIPGPYCLRSLIRYGGLMIGGLFTALIVVTLVSGLSFGWVEGLVRSGDVVGWTTPSTAVGMIIEYAAGVLGLRVPAVVGSRVASIAPFAVILIVLWWRARHGHALHKAGLALAAAAVLAPRFHPWYATWPLAVLAATVRRVHWLVLPCVIASFVVLPEGRSILRSTRLPGELLTIGLIAWAGVLGVRRLRSRGGDSGRGQAAPVRRSSRPLTIMSAADSAYFRCLLQLFKSLNRHVAPGMARYVAYDLGLTPLERHRLSVMFPSVELRRFDSSAYPDFVGVRERAVNTNAWKPQVIQDVAADADGILLWLDSATVVCASLDPVITWTDQVGLYAPFGGTATIGELTHPTALEVLSADAKVRALRQRASGVLGFDTAAPTIRRLLDAWARACLDVRVSAPPGATHDNHRFDQSALNVVLAREADLVMTDDELDINSDHPTPIFRTRNKVSSWMPLWLDPVIACWFWLYRTIDVGLWKLKRQL